MLLTGETTEAAMLGIVFTEFFDLVDEAFGEEILDDIIDMANLSNDGAYTAVGRYATQIC